VSDGFTEQTTAVFAPDGLLAKAFSQFTPRQAQTELATAVAQSIMTQSRFVAEAGTGIGKTFAYLVPALLSGQKVMVSTGTKTLQDQLFQRDLPRLQQALGSQAHVALLKGRSNYVCHYHLERHLQQGRFERPGDGATLQKIKWFAARSETGDRSDCHEVNDAHEAWGYAISSRDNCLGQECPDWERCFVIKARKQAQAADVVVINHHLFCADSALRDEGVAEILPSSNVLIFDEAHQLPDTCVQFFGSMVSTRQLTDWYKDTLAIGVTEARDALVWLDVLSPVDRAARDLRLAWPNMSSRLAGPAIAAQIEFISALKNVIEVFGAALVTLEPARVRSPLIEKAVARGHELTQALDTWRQALLAPASTQKSSVEKTETAQDSDWGEGDGPQVCWGQTNGHNLQLHLTPLYIGRLFAKRLDEAGPMSAIFLSATLAVDGKFEFFKRQLGLQQAVSAQWASPFDYANHGLMYLPQDLGNPNDADFTVRFLQALWPLIEQNQGRVFLLCTTLRAVKKAGDWLRIKLGNTSFEAQLLVQGEASKHQQLDQFRSAANPILVGSASFWEGVDVVGDQLSLVAIDKIPFAPPDDPMLQARVESLEKRGIDAFATLQIPAAAISMKQGVGRLIRSEQDRGLLMIGDARLYTKGYGKKIMRSLPPFKVTTEAATAANFVAQMASARLATNGDRLE
jgi:ATP-dependent DNA helicase DinG